MKQTFFEAVENNPIIAAVKNTEDLDVCCNLEDGGTGSVYPVWRHLLYTRDRTQSKRVREDRHGACGSRRRVESERYRS